MISRLSLNNNPSSISIWKKRNNAKALTPTELHLLVLTGTTRSAVVTDQRFSDHSLGLGGLTDAQSQVGAAGLLNRPAQPKTASAVGLATA